MSDLADLAHSAVENLKHKSTDGKAVNREITQLFMLLHGAFGNSFTSKYATGQLDANGRDRGVLSAMQVWQRGLAEFPADVLHLAVTRLLDVPSKFPPDLPGFRALCREAMPRAVYVDPDPVPLPNRLPAPAPIGPIVFEALGDGLDWARRIMAEIAAGKHKAPQVVRDAKCALGLSLKK